MNDDRELAHRALRESAAAAASLHVALDAAYLEAITLVESLETNQPGADKTWVAQAEQAFHKHYRDVQPA